MLEGSNLLLPDWFHIQSRIKLVGFQLFNSYCPELKRQLIAIYFWGILIPLVLLYHYALDDGGLFLLQLSLALRQW